MWRATICVRQMIQYKRSRTMGSPRVTCPLHSWCTSLPYAELGIVRLNSTLWTVSVFGINTEHFEDPANASSHRPVIPPATQPRSRNAPFYLHQNNVWKVTQLAILITLQISSVDTHLVWIDSIKLDWIWDIYSQTPSYCAFFALPFLFIRHIYIITFQVLIINI